jgi:hypothetical protein
MNATWEQRLRQFKTQPDPMIYEQKKNSGCGSNTFLDLDLLVNRGIGWVGWKYQSGWVEWEFDWNAFASWYEAENVVPTWNYVAIHAYGRVSFFDDADRLLALVTAIVVIAPIVAVQQSLLRRKAGELLTEKELMVKQLVVHAGLQLIVSKVLASSY